MQLGLFEQDPQLDIGAELRDAGIRQARKNADANWLRAARTCIMRCARVQPQLTSDDVWERLAHEFPDAATHEPRAMGAIMQDAQRQGIIVATDRFVPTRRPQAHKQPCRVWTSLTCDQEFLPT